MIDSARRPDAGPLRRLRGLSAGQDRRPRRRRRRAAAGARPPRHRGAHAPPRLPRRDGEARPRPGSCTTTPRSSACRPASSPPTVAGLDLIVIDARRSTTAPAAPTATRRGRDHPDNWRRFGALGRAAADIAMGMVPEFLPDLVHAHDWQAGLAPAYLRFYGVPRALGHDHPQHRLPGRLPRQRLPGAGAAAAGRRPRRRRVLRRRRLPQGRPRQRQRHHHRQPDLRRGDQDPGLRHGPRRPDRRPLGRAARHRQRHRHRRLEPRDRPAPRRHLHRPQAAGPRRQPRRARRPLRPPRRRRAALRPRQPPHLAEGHRPPRLDHRPGHRPRRPPPRRPRHRRRRAWRRPSARSPPSSPAASAPSSATTSRSPT